MSYINVNISEELYDEALEASVEEGEHVDDIINRWAELGLKASREAPLFAEVMTNWDPEEEDVED